MYAIVKVGGKQYRVESGDSLVVDRMSANEGDKVDLVPLLFRPDGDDGAVFAGGDLEKVKVEATVTGHERGKKVRVLKYKPKRGYRRRSGARADLTRLAIGDIKQLSRKPAGAAKAADSRAAEASSAEAGATEARPVEDKPAAAKPAAPKKPAAEKPAPKKPAAKKPAAKKPAAKKPAAKPAAEKKPAAKKPAAKKPAAKKPAAKKPATKKEG
jgi:large subunit ribosomal protein L21